MKMRSTFLRALFGFGCLAIAVLPALAIAQNQEETAKRIAGKLMAPCCWAEPVSQHLSPVAEEMRGEIRAMLAEGRSEQAILDFYVAKYGERILASPPARGFNLLAYVLPWVFAGAGILVLVLILKRWLALKPTQATAPTISARDEERIAQELRDFES